MPLAVLDRDPVARRPSGLMHEPRGAGSDAHDPDGIGAAYREMPDFDGPRDFLTQLAAAQVTGEYRPHAVRYARRPTAPG